MRLMTQQHLQPPQHELTINYPNNCWKQFCLSKTSDDPTQEATGKTRNLLTAAGNQMVKTFLKCFII